MTSQDTIIYAFLKTSCVFDSKVFLGAPPGHGTRTDINSTCTSLTLNNLTSTLTTLMLSQKWRWLSQDRI